MGPSVKFTVDPKASAMLDKQLISNDLRPGLERVQWMVFKYGNESWDLVAHGGSSPNFFDELLKHCPEKECRHIIFRSDKAKTDCWIKYIPEEAGVKEKTYFATASLSLFADARVPKVHMEIREHKSLRPDNPEIQPYL